MKSGTIFRSFFAMVKARTMEFVRDRGTFFWNLLFPVLLVFGFSIAFSGDGDAVLSIGTVGQVPAEFELFETRGIEQIDYQEKGMDTEEALEKLRRHQMDMLIDFESGSYYINSEGSSAEIVGTIMDNSPDVERWNLSEQEVSGEAIRYVDWLVPGVIGMNMMFSCLFGVGFVLVRYRKNGVLKRMKATPVSALNFVSAQAVSRLMIVLVTSTVVFTGTNLVLNFMMNGSYLNLLILTALAIACLISIGLVFASRIKTEELANGLLNLLTFPMMILSGVFVSLENAPKAVRMVSNALPLTHFIDGARAIMLDGAGLMDILPHLAYLVIVAIVMTLLSAVLFRWD